MQNKHRDPLDVQIVTGPPGQSGPPGPPRADGDDGPPGRDGAKQPRGGAKPPSKDFRAMDKFAGKPNGGGGGGNGSTTAGSSSNTAPSVATQLANAEREEMERQQAHG